MGKRTRLISAIRMMVFGKFIFTEWADRSISIEELEYQNTQNDSARSASTLDHATLTGSGVRALAQFISSSHSLQHAS